MLAQLHTFAELSARVRVNQLHNHREQAQDAAKTD